MLTWAISNNESDPIRVEFYATGEGSELFVFEKIIELQPAERKIVEIFVSVPKDHKDNVEYHPNLFALKRGFLEEGATGMIVNSQLKTLPIIKIGENPVFSSPKIIESKVPKPIKVEPTIVEEIEETLEEKMERIKAVNAENIIEEKETESIPTPVNNQITDYIPEPDSEPIEKTTNVDKVECNFIEWILSLFGLSKC
jgi:hypothetical protein